MLRSILRDTEQISNFYILSQDIAMDCTLVQAKTINKLVEHINQTKISI